MAENTNWLELEVDQVEATNAAIEQQQQQWNQHFEVAIAEAKRMEEVKSKQMEQLISVIGQGAEVYKGWKDHQNNKALYKAQWDAKTKTKEVIGGETKGVFSSGEYKPSPVKINYEGADKDQTFVTDKNQEALLKKEQKELDKLQLEQNKLYGAKNDLNEGWLNGSMTDLHSSTIIAQEMTVSLQEISENEYAKGTEAAKMIPMYLSRIQDIPIQLEGMPHAMSLTDAREAKDLGTIQLLRAHHIGTFLDVAGVNELSDKIKRDVILPEINKVWDAGDSEWRTKQATKAAETSKLRRQNTLKDCLMSDSEDRACLSGYLAKHEWRFDGRKDTAFAKELLLQDIRKLNDVVEPEILERLLIEKFKIRGTGKDGTVEDMDEEFAGEINKVIREGYEKKANKLDDDKKVYIDKQKTKLNEIIEKKLEKNEQLNQVDLDELKLRIKVEAANEGIVLTNEDLLLITGAWEHSTHQDMEDRELTKILDIRMKSDKEIKNWRELLNQIDDNDLREEYKKKLEEHQKNFATPEIIKDFNKDILPEIDAYVNQVSTTTSRTPQKRNIQDNVERDFKARYLDYRRAGILPDKARALAFDDIKKELEITTKNPNLTSKYEAYVEPDREDAETVTRNVKLGRTYVLNAAKVGKNKAVLTQGAYLPGESEKDIEEGKLFLAGKGPAPRYYYGLEKLYPNQNIWSIVNNRVKHAVGGESTDFAIDPEKSIEEAILGDDASKLNHKSSNNGTIQAFKENDATAILSILQKSNDPGYMKGIAGLQQRELEQKGITKTPDQMTVRELTELITTDQWEETQFGLYGITGRDLKGLLEVIPEEDLDRVFDAEFQSELAIRALRLKANMHNSLSTVSWGKPIINISARERKEFNQIIELLPDSAEKTFLNSPYSDLETIIDGGAAVIIEKAETAAGKEVSFPIEMKPFNRIYNWLLKQQQAVGAAHDKGYIAKEKARIEKEKLKFPRNK